MNLTTLEMSKKLKEWGAPQNTGEWWTQWRIGVLKFGEKPDKFKGEWHVTRSPAWNDAGNCAAYDLESLIGWLPKIYNGKAFRLIPSLTATGWYAYYSPVDGSEPKYGEDMGDGDTPLEAVYALAEAIHGKEGK